MGKSARKCSDRGNMEIQFYRKQDVSEDLLQIAVVVSRYRGKWVLCRHKLRDTWEVPGGHREDGESILEAARRELYEETGAKAFYLIPVCVYFITTYAMLYYGEISEFASLPESEIETVAFFEELPGQLTYPSIHPKLVEKVCDFWKRKPEIWDAYYPDGSLAMVGLVRGEAIPEQYRHAVADVFVMHRDGTILLTQRDFKKPNFPGLWESSAGGSVLRGETFEQGARRELLEETGIEAGELIPTYRITTGRVIYQGYVCYTDIPKDRVVLQEEETVAFRWADRETFLRIFESDEFVPLLRERLLSLPGRS